MVLSMEKKERRDPALEDAVPIGLCSAHAVGTYAHALWLGNVGAIYGALPNITISRSTVLDASTSFVDG